MALKIGAADVADVKMGAAQVAKVMLGAQQVWPTETVTVLGTWTTDGQYNPIVDGKLGVYRSSVNVAYVDANGLSVDLDALNVGDVIRYVDADTTAIIKDAQAIEQMFQKNSEGRVINIGWPAAALVNHARVSIELIR